MAFSCAPLSGISHARVSASLSLGLLAGSSCPCRGTGVGFLHGITALAAGKPRCPLPGLPGYLSANSTNPTREASASLPEAAPHRACTAKASPESTMRDLSERFPSALPEGSKSNRQHSRNRGLPARSHLSCTEN